VSSPATLWQTVFGNRCPVEIEIGPGRGDVLLAFAAARPDTNFFAIEHAAGLAEALAAEAAARGLTNVRVVAGDARCVLGLAPPASVATVHVYFPDPWPKTRHRHRRLFDRQDLADAIVRVLAGGGAVHVATDLPALGERARANLHAAGLREVPARGPARPVSKFERKYAAAGTWAATFVKEGPTTRRGRAAPAGSARPARRTPRSRSAP
jgi:tRNA (guanine-N7-)-methyltransferase